MFINVYHHLPSQNGHDPRLSERLSGLQQGWPMLAGARARLLHGLNVPKDISIPY
jgi:hypothetical protein